MSRQRIWTTAAVALALIWAGVAVVMQQTDDLVSWPGRVMELVEEAPWLNGAIVANDARQRYLVKVITNYNRLDPGQRRELREETGLTDARLYSITVNPFYIHATGAVQLAVVFAVFVDTDAVTLGVEHDTYEWLSPTAAHRRFTWPRESEALRHIQHLLKGGNAGLVEDVLRIR